MGKPLAYVYYTAAGVIECEESEETVEQHRLYAAITKPTEGRPRLVGTLYFILQEQLDRAAEKPWYSIIDKAGNMTTLRPSAIFGYRVLESLGGDAAEPQIGFRSR